MEYSFAHIHVTSISISIWSSPGLPFDPFNLHMNKWPCYSRPTCTYFSLPSSMCFIVCIIISIISEIHVVFQGDRTRNVGVVDSEYVVHKGIQTLGGSGNNTTKVFVSLLSRCLNWFLSISFLNLYCHCKPKIAVTNSCYL